VIFVTVGTIMPFDRLVRAMDEWAAQTPEVPAFAQIGKGSHLPAHMPWDRILSPAAYTEKVEASTVIVAHAGVGSYLKAAAQGRPLVLLPRRKALKEHTTDHQLATARWLEERDGVFLAWTEDDLPACIEAAQAHSGAPAPFSSAAPEAFTARLRAFIAGSGT